MINRFIGVAALAGWISTAANGSTEKLLYSFPADSYPAGRPDQDSKGTLYGTAYDLDGSGAIYQLKQKNGTWRYNTLYAFSGSDGTLPFAGPVVDRTTGILYGTTVRGGPYGYGTIYSLAPAGRGWNANVLYSFASSYGPDAVLLRDKTTGDLYGTTYSGGTGCGTAFKLAQLNGTWAFNTTHSFQRGSDTCGPVTQLRRGAKAGTLIGAASNGESQIFELKEAHGVWSASIIYTFTGRPDGARPWDLDVGGDGTIYGVTNLGSQYRQGVVFKLIPNRKKYAYTVIYNFRRRSDASYGIGINFDAATGNLYGTSYYGGIADEGTVFRLTPTGNTWTETILHSFTGGPDDGAHPVSRPIVDRTTGALYGTTEYGGTSNGGTVYMLQP